VPPLSLTLLPDRLAISQLPPNETVPPWATSACGFSSITKTAEEVSIVCAEDAVPPDVKCEPNWRLLKIDGPFDFAVTGILAAAATPLAEAVVPIFAISTYDTDYILVKQDNVERAVQVLKGAGHRVRE
jgi:hypothetical protein